jgi:signal peptidase I
LGLGWFAAIEMLIFAQALIARSPLLPPVLNLGGILIPIAGYWFLTRSAVCLARSVRQTYTRTVWNRWYLYLGVLVVAGGLSFFFSEATNEFVVKGYKTPAAASMAPTLLSGDYILVDKLSYKLGKNPERGDVIVFEFPEDESKNFVKRIIGTPGDIVEIRSKQVIINGIPLNDQRYTQLIDPGIIDRSLNPRDNFGPVTVPGSSYFVLGDNRDQSLDSRFWGYVEASKIRGKATIICWSWSGLEEWSEWVRWERIGQRIQSRL